MTAIIIEAASRSSLFEAFVAFLRDLRDNIEASSRLRYEAHLHGLGGL